MEKSAADSADGEIIKFNFRSMFIHVSLHHHFLTSYFFGACMPLSISRLYDGRVPGMPLYRPMQAVLIWEYGRLYFQEKDAVSG